MADNRPKNLNPNHKGGGHTIRRPSGRMKAGNVLHERMSPVDKIMAKDLPFPVMSRLLTRFLGRKNAPMPDRASR